MIDLIAIVLFLTFNAYIAGYREVEALVRDDSWLRKWFRIKFWYGKWNLDSYHFMGGLRWLLMVSAVLTEAYWLVVSGELLVQVFFFVDVLASDVIWGLVIAIAHIPLYWWFWYYQRNIFMHVISRKKEYRKFYIWNKFGFQFKIYKYLNPFQIKKEN